MGVTHENGLMKGPPGMSLKSIEQGAATTAWCAVSPQLSSKGGVYCADCDIFELVPDDSPLPSGAEVRRYAVDGPAAEAIWNLSEQLTSITGK